MLLIWKKILQRLLFNDKNQTFYYKQFDFLKPILFQGRTLLCYPIFIELYQSFSDEFEVRGAFLDTTKPFNWVWQKSVIVKRKVLQHSFEQNRSILKNMTVLLYAYFYNISLNVLRSFFFNIYNLPHLHSPNICKIKVKVGRKANYFFYFMGLWTNRITVFNSFFSLICIEPRGKQSRDLDFFHFKLNNRLLTFFMQNRLSKLVNLLK